MTEKKSSFFLSKSHIKDVTLRDQWWGGVVARALASHQCNLGSIFFVGSLLCSLLKNLHLIKFDLCMTPQALSFQTYHV